MDLETLKTLFKIGVITQEQFNLALSGIQTQPEEKQEKEQEEQKKTNIQENPETKEQEIQPDIALLVKKELEKYSVKWKSENEKLKIELEKERKKNLSADELKVLEMKEKEVEIEEREKALKEQENRLYAIKALKKAGLDTGDEESLEIVDFVIGNEETKIDNKVRIFKELIDKKVKSEVDKVFKENGRNPEKGTSRNTGENPYIKGQENLTKQMELELNNPEVAKKMKAAAGLF